jgi:Nif-specific regulatory protein
VQTVNKPDNAPGGSLGETVENLERERIVEALKSTRGNMAKAARLIGITERKFTYRVAKYGIDFHYYR